jgi:hypothetical protein
MRYKVNAHNAVELNKLVQYSYAKVTQVIELEKYYILIFDCEGRVAYYKAMVKKSPYTILDPASCTIKKMLNENRLVDSILPVINNVEPFEFDGHKLNSIVYLPLFISGVTPDKLHLGESLNLIPQIDHFQDLKSENDIIKFDITEYKIKENGSSDMLTLKLSDAVNSCEVKLLLDGYHVTLFPEFEELSTYDNSQLRDFIEFIKIMYKRIEYFKSKVKKEMSKKHKINMWDEQEFWQTNILEEMDQEILSWIKERKEDLLKTKKIFNFSGLNFLNERLQISQLTFMTKQELEEKKDILLKEENYEEISKLK